jgi:hypothetical protein
MQLIIPHGQPFSPLEKLLLPFTIEVWLCIATKIMVWLVAIQIIDCFSEKVKFFVFGRMVRLNIIEQTFPDLFDSSPR